MTRQGTTQPRRDDRIIIHFDYDCFYASVFENENPALKSLPLAVQQKQIIVTCNYEARRRGLRKLQLVSDAKRAVPDLVIVLGEELGRFRDASKSLYKFLEAFTWSGKVERLGFDEVFLDVSDIVDYNQALLNPFNLRHSFFQINRNDPTVGFGFDATIIAGHGFPTPQEALPSPTVSTAPNVNNVDLRTRLILGSHFAQHLRLSLEEEKGYTSTVGISTNKLLSKLAGNLHKPKGQTTLLPPYEVPESDFVLPFPGDSPPLSSVTAFIDSHDIGKIPGIGFKIAQRIRNQVLSRPADFDNGLIWGGIKESVTVHDVRLFPGMGPEMLDKILGGLGVERSIGSKVWGLINGIDNAEVQQAKTVPTQISIEDSYSRLDTATQVQKELRMLATSLIKRMHTDLLEDDEDTESGKAQRWIALPRTLRLSTRPRPPLTAGGPRTRSMSRISRSAPLPSFVFNLKDSTHSIVEKLVEDSLIPMFRRLHPQQSGWNLSLVNIGVANMVLTANELGKGVGRDIGRMFRKQEDVLRDWNVEDRDVSPDHILKEDCTSEVESPGSLQAEPSVGGEAVEQLQAGSEDMIYPTQNTVDEQEQWYDDDDEHAGQEECNQCGAVMPAFAMAAHERFHNLEE